MDAVASSRDFDFNVPFFSGVFLEGVCCSCSGRAGNCRTRQYSRRARATSDMRGVAASGGNGGGSCPSLNHRNIPGMHELQHGLPPSEQKCGAAKAGFFGFYRRV